MGKRLVKDEKKNKRRPGNSLKERKILRKSEK